jgi:uncharacterized YigZ family protein
LGIFCDEKFKTSSLIDSYKTLAGECSFELKEMKSKFVALGFHIKSAQEALTRYSEIRKKYYDASHFPYAYRLSPEGNVFKYSDDGEPSGTGGKPLYDALTKHSLTDSLVIVVRYFGGTKLGVGGLKRAFFEAADSCLSSAKTKIVPITRVLDLEFDYKYISPVMKILNEEEVRTVGDNSAERCRLTVEVKLGSLEDLKIKLISATNGSMQAGEVNS